MKSKGKQRVGAKFSENGLSERQSPSVHDGIFWAEGYKNLICLRGDLTTLKTFDTHSGLFSREHAVQDLCRLGPRFGMCCC